MIPVVSFCFTVCLFDVCMCDTDEAASRQQTLRDVHGQEKRGGRRDTPSSRGNCLGGGMKCPHNVFPQFTTVSREKIVNFVGITRFVDEKGSKNIYS